MDPTSVRQTDLPKLADHAVLGRSLRSADLSALTGNSSWAVALRLADLLHLYGVTRRHPAQLAKTIGIDAFQPNKRSTYICAVDLHLLVDYAIEHSSNPDVRTAIALVDDTVFGLMREAAVARSAQEEAAARTLRVGVFLTDCLDSSTTPSEKVSASGLVGSTSAMRLTLWPRSDDQANEAEPAAAEPPYTESQFLEDRLLQFRLIGCKLSGLLEEITAEGVKQVRISEDVREADFEAEAERLTEIARARGVDFRYRWTRDAKVTPDPSVFFRGERTTTLLDTCSLRITFGKTEINVRTEVRQDIRPLLLTALQMAAGEPACSMVSDDSDC